MKIKIERIAGEVTVQLKIGKASWRPYDEKLDKVLGLEGDYQISFKAADVILRVQKEAGEKE